MIMRMPEKESLKYLESKGYKMTPRHYYRLKKGINEFGIEKIVEMGGTESMINGFMAQHMERIRQMELVQTELWQEYHSCTSHKDRIEALGCIAQIQPLISAYYEATHLVFEKRIMEFERKKGLEMNHYRNSKYDNNPVNKFIDNNKSFL